MKKTAASSPKDRLRALIDLADCSNADLVSVVGRDDKGKLLSVGIVAEGETAVALNRFLKRMAEGGPGLTSVDRGKAAT